MQKKIFKLKQLFLQHKLPPALLLHIHTLEHTVPENVSLELQSVVKFMLCLKKNLTSYTTCETCTSCNLYKEKIHPDFLLLSPELNKNITIEQVRNLIDFISYTPTIAEKKIVLGIDINKINLTAANALLKSLDDPKHHLIMLYLTTSRLQIIPTLLSRLVLINLYPSLDEHTSTNFKYQTYQNHIKTDLINIYQGQNIHIDEILSIWNKNHPDDLLYLLYMTISNILKSQLHLKKFWDLLDDVIDLQRSAEAGNNLNLSLHLQVALNKLGNFK